MSDLSDWAEAVCRELGLTDIDPGRGTVDLVLDLARDAAHNVARPAAPLTTYLLGIAVGRQSDPQAAGDLAARVTQLAAEWPGRQAPHAASGGAVTTEGNQKATLRRNHSRESDQEPL